MPLIFNKPLVLGRKAVFDADAFTVIGSPAITSEGIASGFNNSNAAIVQKTLDFTKPFEITGEFITGSVTVREQFIVYSRMHNDAVPFVFGIHTDGKFIGYYPISAAMQAYVFGAEAVPETKYYFKINYDGTRLTMAVNTDKESLTPFLSSNSAVLSNLSSLYLCNRSNLARPLSGKFDLKQFKIIIDGAEIFSGSKLITPEWEAKPFKFDVKSINAQTEETPPVLQLMKKAPLTLNEGGYLDVQDINGADDMLKTIDTEIERK